MILYICYLYAWGFFPLAGQFRLVPGSENVSSSPSASRRPYRVRGAPMDEKSPEVVSQGV